MAHLEQIEAIEKPPRPHQGEEGINTEGDLEVPPAALEELVVNMLCFIETISFPPCGG